MFQGYPETIKLPFPFNGINANAATDPSYAKYIQNMVLSENKSGELRNGTNLIASFEFDAEKKFTDQIGIFSYLKTDGSAEILVYQNYLSKFLPDVLMEAEDVTVEEVTSNVTKISISLVALTDNQKAIAAKQIFNDVRIYISQDIGGDIYPDYADISNVIFTEEELTFNIPFPLAFFKLDGGDPDFEIWVERGAIYKIESGAYSENPLKSDLDPNVIPISSQFKNFLFMCNGVDPVLTYDGTEIKNAQGTLSLVLTEISNVARVFTLKFSNQFLASVTDNIYPAANISLSYSEIGNVLQEVIVSSITFSEPNGEGIVTATLTVDRDPIENVNGIVYKTDIPLAFSYVYLAQDRMWALGPGRPIKDIFRSFGYSTSVYYSYKVDDPEGWFNPKTNQIDFIDIASRSDGSENLEAIKAHSGKMLFIGRETCQVWEGYDPTLLDDGQKFELQDFKHVMTKPIGIIQKKLFCETSNDLLFFSRHSILPFSYINEYKQDSSPLMYFSNPISEYVTSQLSQIKTEREYRGMDCFAYPYGRFLGFKIKYSCFIYNLTSSGGWTIFTGNFSEATSFKYNRVTQSLYLGMQGKTLIYSDKLTQNAHLEYGKGGLSWSVFYNWMYPGSTWANNKVFLIAKTIEDLDVSFRIYTNFNASDYAEIKISLKETGSLYDLGLYDVAEFSEKETFLAGEILGFISENFLIKISGVAKNSFVLDSTVLAGGSL